MIDYTKTIFVIDSPLIAMVVAIIARENPVNVIYEFKAGVDSQSDLEMAYDDILANCSFRSKLIRIVPSPYFLWDSHNFFASIRRVAKFQREMNKVALNYEFFYCGPPTSSIMRLVPKNKKITIDHGAGEYVERVCGTPKQSYKFKVALALCKLFGVCYFKEGVSNTGFTLAKLIDDTYIHIDYRNYEIPNRLLNVLALTKQHICKSSKVTLVCPVSMWHSHKGFSSDTSKYDDINIEMVRHTCETSELILFKFHPTVYAVKSPLITLPENLATLGYECINFDNLLPQHLVGNLPAEILVNFFEIKKIVSEGTATMFNVSHNAEVNVVSTAKSLDGLLGRRLRIVRNIEILNKYLYKEVCFSEY